MQVPTSKCIRTLMNGLLCFPPTKTPVGAGSNLTLCTQAMSMLSHLPQQSNPKHLPPQPRPTQSDRAFLTNIHWVRSRACCRRKMLVLVQDPSAQGNERESAGVRVETAKVSELCGIPCFIAHRKVSTVSSHRVNQCCCFSKSIKTPVNRRASVVPIKHALSKNI